MGGYESKINAYRITVPEVEINNPYEHQTPRTLTHQLSSDTFSAVSGRTNNRILTDAVDY